VKIKIDALEIIGKYYQPGSIAHGILLEHGRAVADKARRIALILHLDIDMDIVEQAALLHDIGMFMTRAPGLGCHGDRDYICHGYLGRELLEREGLPILALVCERHVGAGLTAGEIAEHHLPLPMRDMLPLSVEEKIICYADKFFSKGKNHRDREKTVEEIRAGFAGYGKAQIARFDALHRLLSS